MNNHASELVLHLLFILIIILKEMTAKVEELTMAL
jgi:hypothetical protein